MKQIKHQWKILLPLLLAAMLAGALFSGCGAPNDEKRSESDMQGSVLETPSRQEDLLPEALPEQDAPGGSAEEPKAESPAKPAVQKPQKEPDGQKKPVVQQPQKPTKPNQPQKPETEKTEYTCTISISCATILNNMDLLDEGKKDLVPADGWILAPTSVSFSEGESVFDVLRRTCKEQKIHMEFEDTPLYDSAYIEGIGNLYEFDCGALSGWEYAVNNWFPNYGCSRYGLKDGDVIQWLYTCDLGADIGAPVGDKAA